MNEERGRFRLRRVIGYTLLAVTVVAAGWGLWRSVPFDLPSYATWAGVIVAFGALISLAKPQRWLGIATRGRASLLLAVGVAVTMAGALWPSSLHRSSREKHRIDDFLPEYQFSEYHEARTRAPIAAVIDATRNVSVADIPTARVLMALRRLADGRVSVPPADPKPWIDEARSQQSAFIILDESDARDLVLGLPLRINPSVKPQPVRCSPSEFRDFAGPGDVRVVFDLRVTDEGGGVVCVSTETRIMGADATTRRAFARYWRFVYPGSAIIRRVWLDAMIARAEHASIFAPTARR